MCVVVRTEGTWSVCLRGWTPLSRSSAGQKRRSRNKENISVLKAASGLFVDRDKTQAVVGGGGDGRRLGARLLVGQQGRGIKDSHMLLGFLLSFSFLAAHCVGCTRNHFRFLRVARMAAGRSGWLGNTTLFKVLEGVSRKQPQRRTRGEARGGDRVGGGGGELQQMKETAVYK